MTYAAAYFPWLSARADGRKLERKRDNGNTHIDAAI